MSAAFKEVMATRGLGLPADEEVAILGADPVFSTRFKIGETCAAVLAGVGVAVSDIWELKTGRRQRAAIHARHAAAALRSVSYMQRPGPDGRFGPFVNEAHQAMRRITQPWPTRDGRWFLPHFGLPNLQQRVLKVLGAQPDPVSVAKAVAQWDALDLEAAIDEARACGAMVRTHTEWLAHPHGQALAAKPIVEIMKIGDSDPEPLPQGEHPLAGVAGRHAIAAVVEDAAHQDGGEFFDAHPPYPSRSAGFSEPGCSVSWWRQAGRKKCNGGLS